MLSAADIKGIKLPKFMGGYKQEEVDILMDKIEADYLQFDRIIKENQIKIQAYENEIKELKASQDRIQNVLLGAQGLADKIVSEAKEKSEEIIHNAEKSIIAITEKEKELSENFELKAYERKASLEKELTDMVNKAQKKADSITAAANDSVARQQMLFDKLKLEIAAFKSSVSAKYKEHIELLSQVPDSVPSDPQYLAQAVIAALDKEPSPDEFISKFGAEKKPEENIAAEENPTEGFKVEGS